MTRIIILENRWVYLIGTQYFVSEGCSFLLQNAHCKAYKEKLKDKVKDVPKDE